MSSVLYSPVDLTALRFAMGGTSPGDDYPVLPGGGYPVVLGPDPRSANTAATLSTGWVLRRDRAVTGDTMRAGYARNLDEVTCATAPLTAVTPGSMR